jgi:hypothetical protein
MTRRTDIRRTTETKPGPLERQKVKCPRFELHSPESTECWQIYDCGHLCYKGTNGLIDEPLESQVKRLQEMCKWLADDACPDCNDCPRTSATCKECRLVAAFKAVGKEKENG